MELFVNACVLLTTVGAFGYLCFVILYPERF
ncbi:MAG: potassium-transporting ATPase subunit F [Planctomycetaceae bacterium]